MLSHFDFEILNDKEFKEDSVREELLVPIIKALGYVIVRAGNFASPASDFNDFVKLFCFPAFLTANQIQCSIAVVFVCSACVQSVFSIIKPKNFIRI